jgi:hypothetical protein
MVVTEEVVQYGVRATPPAPGSEQYLTQTKLADCST